MASVNKVMLMGNLTRDPELRYTPSGAAVCEFSIALNRKYKNKQSGQQVDEVSFVEIVAWGRTAEVAAEYLKKGRAVFVEGRVQQDRWESPEGKKMSKIKFVAENIQFLGGKGDKQEGQAAPAEEVQATPPEEEPAF